MGTLSAEEYFRKVQNMVHSSSQVLRKLFQTRWQEKTGEDWEHAEEQGQFFLNCQDGENVNKNATDRQKEKIKKGCLDEWDVSLLSLVLLNFGDEDSYKLENETMGKLTKLRNELEHHPTKKFSREEYNKKVESFKTALKMLKESDSEIEKIIDKAGISCSTAAWEATKKLLERGDEHVKAEEFDNAVACFDEATTMPSLLPVAEGAVYEKRADCYLKQAKYLKQNQKRGDADKYVVQAMLDATQALKLNDCSWNAHFLIAQCHRWNSCYEQAIQHYNRALALSPAQKHVNGELDSCKALFLDRETRHSVHPFNAPLSADDLVRDYEAHAGKKLGWSEEQILNFGSVAFKSMGKGTDTVFEGHKHFHGWSVPQNAEKAARYYKTAADAGNIRGVFYLAMCYEHGKGVEQDLEIAYQLYLQAANMSPSHKHYCVPICTLKNEYVAQSQFLLGTWYQNGIVVELDYLEAVMWYEKALENGCGGAAHNLGRMYAEGLGLPRNEKKSEMYWTLAVNYKHPNSAYALMNYYIREMEPEKAHAMFQTGKELGSVEMSEMSENEFKNLLKAKYSGLLDLKALEKNVIEHERKYQLESKGMTFLERFQRLVFYENSLVEKGLQCLHLALGINDGLNKKQNSLSESDLKTIERRAIEGSITAQNVLKTISAAIALSSLIDDSEFSHDDVGNENHALDLLYECCTGEFHAIRIILYSPPVKNKLKALVSELFEKKCGVKGDDDMKIRFCYVCFHSLLTQSPDDFKMELLKEGLKMYPENVHYYDLLSSLCDRTGDHKSGLEFCIKGLERFPDNVDLLFWKATHFHMLHELEDVKIPLTNCSRSKKRRRNIVAAYVDFLSKAPADHPRVPRSLYSLAHIYMVDSPVDKAAEMRKVERYFNLGKKSVENMVPCYVNLGESSSKRVVESFVSFMAAARELGNDENSNPKQPFHDAPKEVFERKPYLWSLERKKILLEHRKNIANITKLNEADEILSSNYHEPRLSQVAPKRMGSIKPITLREMSPVSDAIFEDRVIDLTIVEDPIFAFSSIQLVAEDENGDVTRLHFYNVEQNKEAETNLAHGSTIAIMNPYMRIRHLDWRNALRNYEPRCILYLDKVEKMCRFCGEANAERKCTRCKKAYCSRECQELDWKLFKHQLICSKQLE